MIFAKTLFGILKPFMQIIYIANFKAELFTSLLFILLHAILILNILQVQNMTATYL